MTVSDLGHPVRPDDPQASLRAELLGQLVAVQFDLEDAIAELERSGSSTDTVRSSLQLVGDLQRQVGSANPVSLAAIRGEIAAGAATGRALAQQSRTLAGTETASEKLANATAQSRAVMDRLMADVFEARIFDPYLQFGSTEDEAAYRQREAQRIAIIEAERRKGSPDGDLNASGAAVGQLADAAAHGAGDSPEFRQRWEELVTSTAQLRDAAHANGISTEEFDRRLRDDLRAIMRSKGLTDSEIDVRFAANPDPLEAAKAYVDERDVSQLASQQSANVEATVATSATAEATTQYPETSAANAMAVLMAAGVTMSEPDPRAAPEHGVTTEVALAAVQTRLG